jgi:hypothetical protein
MNTKDEALKLALEALEENHHLIEEHERPEYLALYDRVISSVAKALASEANHAPTEREQPAPVAEPHKQQEPVAWRWVPSKVFPDYVISDDPEKARSATSHGMNIEPLYTSPPAQQEPVAIEYWLQDTMESGRWVTTDNMEKATAEKMLSGEYGDVYPQGRIVESSPPNVPAARASKPLTDEEISNLWCEVSNTDFVTADTHEFARAIERAHGIHAAEQLKEDA